MVQATYNIGEKRSLSVEVVGLDADVEYYRVNGTLISHSLNPALNAGEGVCCIHSPSSAPCVVSVGATTYRDSIQNLNGEWKKYWLGHGGERAPFSSVGPTYDGRLKPDVMAPGNNIVSSYSSFYLETHPDNADITWDVAHFPFNGRTYVWNSNSGTSMSCPAVAGAIALWLQAKPDLTPEQVLDVISHTSRHYDESMTWPNHEYGYGEIDAYKGLLHVLGLTTSIPTLSRHQPRGVTFRMKDGRLFVDGVENGIPIRIYTTDGQLVVAAPLMGGNVSLPVGSPAGVYAVQVGTLGSTLIRK